MDRTGNILPRIVAIVIEPLVSDQPDEVVPSDILPVCRNSEHIKHELSRSERDVFHDFINLNKSCYWNPQLMETFQFITYAGFFVKPYALLVSSKRQIYLDNILAAWSRKVLRSPSGFKIINIGELSEISIFSDPQPKFTPLSEAVCLLISDCNRLNVTATFDEIMTRLCEHYPSMYHPEESHVYQMLDVLQREGEIFHTGDGYRIVTPNAHASKNCIQVCDNLLVNGDDGRTIQGPQSHSINLVINGPTGGLQSQPINLLINGTAIEAIGGLQSRPINLLINGTTGWIQNTPVQDPEMTTRAIKCDENLASSRTQETVCKEKSTNLQRSFSLREKRSKNRETTVGCIDGFGSLPHKKLDADTADVPQHYKVEKKNSLLNKLFGRNKKLNIKLETRDPDEHGTSASQTDNLLSENDLKKVNNTIAPEPDCPSLSTPHSKFEEETVPNNERLKAERSQSMSPGPRSSSGSENLEEIPIRRVRKYRKSRKSLRHFRKDFAASVVVREMHRISNELPPAMTARGDPPTQLPSESHVPPRVPSRVLYGSENPNNTVEPSPNIVRNPEHRATPVKVSRRVSKVFQKYRALKNENSRIYSTVDKSQTGKPLMTWRYVRSLSQESGLDEINRHSTLNSSRVRRSMVFGDRVDASQFEWTQDLPPDFSNLGTNHFSTPVNSKTFRSAIEYMSLDPVSDFVEEKVDSGACLNEDPQLPCDDDIHRSRKHVRDCPSPSYESICSLTNSEKYPTYAVMGSCQTGSSWAGSSQKTVVLANVSNNRGRRLSPRINGTGGNSFQSVNAACCHSATSLNSKSKHETGAGNKALSSGEVKRNTPVDKQNRVIASVSEKENCDNVGCSTIGRVMCGKVER